MMGELSAEQFAQRAFDLDLLDERQLQRIWAFFGTQSVPLKEFKQHLVGKGLMTSYQIERMLRGERGGFFYGDYKVLYQVGSGSFARVFRAVHRKETDRNVAVKVLRARNANDPEATERFLDEGRLGMSLDHPNIVPIYDVVSDRPTFFLVMEFLEGHTLRQFLRIRRRLEPSEAVGLMQCIVAGLAYAFGRGITHRDLSTSNVFITSHGDAKVVDFGLATLAGDNTTNPRTIDYLGLERATGVKRDDTRSDIYFAGCILYQMLTGEAPLTEVTDRIQRLSVQRYREINPIAKVDASLPQCVTRIVDKAISIDPAARYQKPGEMLAELKLVAGWFADPEKFAAEIGRIRRAPRKSIMVLESNSKMQDLLREGLRKCGYRPLVISRPEIAIRRFEEDAKAAAGILVSTSELGEDALEVFNRFGHDLKTRKLPAILLLGAQHHDWHHRAKLADHRRVLEIPLRFGQLRKILTELMPPTETHATPATSNGGKPPAAATKQAGAKTSE